MFSYQKNLEMNESRIALCDLTEKNQLPPRKLISGVRNLKKFELKMDNLFLLTGKKEFL